MKSYSIKLLAGFAAIVLWANFSEAQIARPQLGFELESGGALRPIFGVAAAATLGDPVLANAISFACSETVCLAKTDAALISFAPGVSGVAAQSAAPQGRALMALDRQGSDPGGGAWIYFSESQQLARWQNGTLEAIDNFHPDGQILSLRAAADGFDYVVVRGAAESESGTWIEHYAASDGSISVLDSLGSSPRAALLLRDGILIATPDELLLRRSDGQAFTFPVFGVKAFHAAGPGYVDVVARGGAWILRTDAGSEALSMLPVSMLPGSMSSAEGK